MYEESDIWKLCPYQTQADVLLFSETNNVRVQYLIRSSWVDKIPGKEVIQVFSNKTKRRVAWLRLRKAMLVGMLSSMLASFAQGAQTEAAAPPLSSAQTPETAQSIAPASWPGYREVESLATSGRAREALRWLDTRLVAHPEDARAVYMKGLVLMQTGRNEEAARWFKMMQSNFPDLTEPYNALAVIYFGRGDLLSAQNVLRAVLAQHPENLTAERNLAEVYLKLARESYEKLRKAMPEDAKIAAMIKTLDTLH